MRKYEIMLILPADADDELVGEVVDRISRVLGESGGEVTKTDRWGRRRFAHEIEKRTEGYYAVVEFTSEPTGLKELDRVLSLVDEVVRFKIVVRPEPSRRQRRAPTADDASGEASTEPPEASEPEASEPEASETEASETEASETEASETEASEPEEEAAAPTASSALG